MSKKIILSVLFIVLFVMYTQAVKVKIITDPKPTCIEPPGVELQLDFKLNMDMDDENFVGQPGSIAVDNSGNIFVFDRLQASIFKFNKEGKFLKRFGRQGRGPGEFAYTGLMSNVILNVQANKLLTFEQAFRRLNIFNTDGKLERDFKLKLNRRFKPVMDSKENLYTPSLYDGVVDVFNNKMELQKTIIDQSMLREFLFYEPMPLYKRRNVFPGTNIHFFFVAQNRLLVFSNNSALVCLTKDGKIEKKFYTWPKRILELYKDASKSAIEDCEEGSQCYQKMTVAVFPDLDDNRFFYIQFSSQTDNKKIDIFKFDLTGKLINLLFVKRREAGYLRFYIKKNNHFYVVENEQIYLYKENKK